MKRSGKMFLTFLGGAAAGALAGILLAPHSGKKNRKSLTKKVNSFRKTLEENVNVPISRLTDFHYD